MKKKSIRLPRARRILVHGGNVTVTEPAPPRRSKKGLRLEQPGTGLRQDVLVIFTSATRRPPWHPIKDAEVPDWVKHPDVMARMVDGEEVMKPHEGPKGSNYYRAVRASDINDALKADH